jgi:chromate transporter
MYRDLVEQRKWIAEADYKEGLALAQIAPGPLAAQLAIYLGYVHYRVLGATVAGFAFVIPSFLMVVGLGWAYVNFGGLSWMQAVFYGVGAAVIGIMAISAHKLATKNIGKDKLLWTIFGLLAAVTIITQSEIAWLFIAAGVLVWLVRIKPHFGATNLGLFPLPLAFLGGADGNLLLQILVFFTKAGSVRIRLWPSGGAFPIWRRGDGTSLAQRQTIRGRRGGSHDHAGTGSDHNRLHRLSGGWFPGCGDGGSATFLPCYLITVIAAPHFKKYGRRPALIAFVDGITAAAVGAIAGSVVVAGRAFHYGYSTATLALLTGVLLWKFKKLREPIIVASAALIGLVIFPLMHHV